MVFGLSRTLESPPSGTPQIAAVDNPLPHVYPVTGPSTLDHHRHNMAKEKEHKPRIEILLDSPYLFLKGVGVDVEPTRLSGHVALYLSQATPIKEITLQFQGKARLPIPPADALTMNSAPLTYVVCTHDWSFLEGQKRASHTLKAGRHLFPFQLRIGGSLPSTTCSPALGGAAVSYRLHAQAVRSGFAFNQTYQADLPVYILRSFPPEAMEYQQSLEIENTWPEKLMYSIMVPHKAWAAGDKLTALVKFSPLLKGVCVLNVTTSIYEQTKIYARSGSQEQTRLVASVKHEFVNGRAVEVADNRPGHRNSSSFPSSPASPASSSSGFGAANPPRTNSSSSLSSLGRQSLSQTPIHASPSTRQQPSTNDAPVASTSNLSHETNEPDSENTEVEAYLSINVPLTITPTHGLAPIIVLHRIRWSIILQNLDGHTSELRCSLPLHLLDYRLLSEAQLHTAATRRLLIGGAEIPSGEVEDTQLPSYNQHIRDRVANMFLPDSATMRVTNPWIAHGASPVHLPDAPHTPAIRSGRSTPLEAYSLTHLPHQPDPNTSNAPLEWVNSELLLSLSGQAPCSPPRSLHPGDSVTGSGTISRTHSRTHSGTHSAVHSNVQSRSRSRSRPGSRGLSLSRLPSRTTSAEREQREQDRHHPLAQIPVAGPETYVHSGHASRNMNSLFSTTMRPSTMFPSGWISRSGGSTHQQPSAAEIERERGAAAAAARPDQVHTIGLPDRSTGTELLHRAFTEVPNYAVASRGFIGGVPPLSSMRGLPSYEETVRTQSDGDLAARFEQLAVPQRSPAPPLTSSVSS